MSEITRRTLCTDLGLALAALGLSNVAFAQNGAQTGAQTGAVSLAKSQNHLQTPLDHSTAFVFEQMPLRYSDAGAPTHDILQGVAPVGGGYLVELHETTIAAGKEPHPPHQHPHVEFILVREGTVDFMIGNPGAEAHHTLTAGSVGYTAPNERHGFRNSGQTTATYFIFSLDKKPA
jgi:quercetin dioxygenase-like cupin family protein